MTEEEKEEKLIKELKLEIEKLKKISTSPTGTYVTFEGLVILLNLIQRKDRQIDLMAEHIEKGCDSDSRIQTKEQIKQYFEKQAKEV